MVQFELNGLSSTAGLLAPVPVNDEIAKLEPQLKRLVCRESVADVHLKAVDGREEQVIDEDEVPARFLSNLAGTAGWLVGQAPP